jgi:VanZ family protein
MPIAQRSTAMARWAAVLGYMAFIFLLSSVSNPPTTPRGSDKVLHGLLYAGLGALFARAFDRQSSRSLPAVVVATAVFGGVYGASDELHQYFTPPRNVEALDVLADTIGAAAGAAALGAWGIIRGRNGV